MSKENQESFSKVVLNWDSRAYRKLFLKNKVYNGTGGNK